MPLSDFYRIINRQLSSLSDYCHAIVISLSYYCHTIVVGVGGRAVVESLDFGAKGPEFKSHPRGPSINVRRSYISDAIVIGCAACRVAMQLSSLVCQYQPVFAGLLQHSVLRMLWVSSCPKLTSRDISERI